MSMAFQNRNSFMPATKRVGLCWLSRILLLWVTVVSAVCGQLSFKDITDRAGTGGPTGPDQVGGHGVMFADVDGDDRPDLYITMIFESPMADLFFRNLGEGRFVNEGEKRGIADFDGGSHGACWADLDQDGDYDLVNGTTWNDSEYPNYNNLFQNDGDGQFVEVTPNTLKSRRMVTRSMLCLDMDRDGDLDLFGVTNYQGSEDPPSESNEVYRNEGDFQFTVVTNGPLHACPAGQGSTDSDYDGDGDIDVLAANRTGPVNILRNQGDGRFEHIAPDSIGIRHRAKDGLTTVDVDNDGDLDLLLAGNDYGELYRNTGSGRFQHWQSFSQTAGYMGGFADLDLDGDLDLVFAGDKRAYLNDGTGHFEPGASVPLSSIRDPRGIAFTDIDGDGDPDFAVADKRAKNRMIENEYSGDRNWLKVRLVSPKGQAGAFGAKVKVYPSDESASKRLLGLREAKSNHGYLAQDDPRLHFGLGRRRAVHLVVEFLDGTRVSRADVEADQTVSLDGRQWPEKTATLWEPYQEWQLVNPSYEGNPYDVTARVTFRHRKTDQEHVTPMFYAGRSLWKFRFTGTRPGVWTFRTASDDPDLDGFEGSVRIQPAGDKSANGFLTTYGNKWGWQGTEDAFVPQLVMYDHPAAFHNKPDQVEQDIQTFLVEHGFNGFHVPVLCRWFDLDEVASDDIEEPNPDPRTFEALEMLITKTYAAGGMVHLWQWGDEQRQQTPARWGLNGREDRRLLRYIAARLGPLPGWSMGYGFDCDEWVDEKDLRLWHRYFHEQSGWFHFLGARDPNPNHPDDPLTQIYEGLDYAGYEHHRPTYDDYVRALNVRTNKPVFSEDRFRIRVPPRYPEKDYNEVLTRRGLYHSAMAGGVANIWGNNHPGGWRDGGGSRPYPHPEWIRTYARFFRDRFTKDLVRAGLSKNGVCLKRPSNAHYLFYVEEASRLRMDLSGMKGSQPAVAVDTLKPYEELGLGGFTPEVQTWTAPYESDWAVAVGGFAE